MTRSVLLAVLLLLAVPMFAEDIAVPRNIVIANVDALVQVDAAASPARRPGATIARDPEGGFRAPSAAELRDLSRQISIVQKQQRALTPKIEVGTDGTLTATLDASHENLTMVFMTDTGRLEHVCAAGTDGALQLLSRKVDAPKTEKEIR